MNIWQFLQASVNRNQQPSSDRKIANEYFTFRTNFTPNDLKL